MVLRVLLALVLYVLPLLAQDAQQLLRLSVGYGTLKATNLPKLSEETKAELARVEKQAQAAGLAGNFGEAMKLVHRNMATIRGEAWTPWRALNAGLTLKVSQALLEPGQKAEVRLGQLFALDEKLAGKVSLTLSLQGAEGEKTLAARKDLDPDWQARPLVVEVTTPEVGDSGYRLTAVLTPASESSETPIRKTVSVRVERGLTARLAALKERCAKIEPRLGEKLRSSFETAQYAVALYDLAAAGEIPVERLNFAQEFSNAAALLEALEKNQDPLVARRGDFRKAYRSKVDNTLQPYRVFVPSGYDPAKAHPLVVALHGMGGDENSYFDGYRQGAFKVEAEQRGYLAVCPKGRQPASMYTGAAEQDVLDVIAEMRRAYNVDPDRIYLTGHSMGGYGTWSVAMNHPHLFAALAPVAGGGNPANLSKIAHIPQLVVHGDNDKTVPVERSRVMVEAARKLNTKLRYIEIPGGSHVDIAVPTFKDIYDWFDAHRRGATADSGGSKQ